MSYCAKCGAPLPPGAQFCPRCGTPLNVAPVTPPPAAPAPVTTPRPAPAPAPAQAHAPVAPPPARARFPWWIIPLVLLILGGLAWLLLAGLPFGGRDREPETPRVATETIAEGTAAPSSTPRETGTIMDVEGERPSSLEPNIQPATQTTAPPTTSQPAPPITPRPSTPQPSQPSTPQPTTRPPATREPATREPATPNSPPLLNDEQASATLRDYVTSRNYYSGVDDDCVRVESRGFRNRGFDYQVWNSCERGGGSRLLGRWRVDALTREVFRQYDDGRYLRP